MPARELADWIDAERQRRAAADADEMLAAGFRSREVPVPRGAGSGFESGGALDICAPSGMLAALADAATAAAGWAG